MGSKSVEPAAGEMEIEAAAANAVAGVLEAGLSDHSMARVDAVSALVPWICDVLQSDKSVTAYGTDLTQFRQFISERELGLFQVTPDHVKIYKAFLLKSGIRPASVARKLSVIRGVYRQFADKGLVRWPVAQAIASIKAPPVKKNSTPAITEQQALAFLAAIPRDSLQGQRDLAMFQTFFITGCRVSAICRARVGDLEFDGAEHYLNVVEKRGRETRKILLDVATSIFAYIEIAGIASNKEGPLFRPLTPDRRAFVDRHLQRQTPWRLVKKYCLSAGIDPSRLTSRGIGVHSLRKTAITNAIRNGANMHEVREFAGHSDIRTTELYYQRREDDAEVAARRISIRAS